MCTAIVKGNLMGRTLDYECSFGEEIVVLPKGYKLGFVHEGNISSKHRIMGVCHMADGAPLFYDGINDHGVGACALNFPKYASYGKKKDGRLNLASFEIISYILAEAKSLSHALEMLEGLNVTDDSFSDSLPPTPLHWLVTDREGSAVIEPLSGDVKIYKNPVGVLTNSPPFDYHLTRLSEITALHPGDQENRLLQKDKIITYSRGMGAMGLPGDYSSVSRFLRGFFVKENTVSAEEGEVESFFHIMDSVAVPLGCSESESGEPVSTVYTSCADLSEGVYYYTTYGKREIRKISFDDFGLNQGEALRRSIF